MPSQQVIACSKALKQKNYTIAFVESASAGKMSYEFSTVEESGAILIGGIVCYNACMKEDVLDIPPELIENFTPESAEVTKAMARSFSKYAAADVSVAITGLTTPGGSETPEKPVGTIFVHIVLPEKEIARRFEFQGAAETIVDKAIDETASLILNELNPKFQK